MRSYQRFSVPAIVAGILVAATLAGCGRAGSLAIVIVDAAQARTVAATTARVSFTYTLQGQSVTTAGVADLKDGEGTYTTHISGLVGSIEAIQVGRVLYEKVPAQLAAAPTPWIKFDVVRAMHQLTGIDAQSLSQNLSSDPGAALDYLKGISPDTRAVGSDVLRGVATTHYRGTVDLTVAATMSTNPDRKTALQQLAKLLGVHTFSLDVWIDTDGRLRRMSYSLDAAKFNLPGSSGSKLSGSADYTFEFFDFGVSFAKPALPNPDQVTDVDSAFSQPTNVLAQTPASSGQPLASVLAPPPESFGPATTSHAPIDAASFGPTGSAAKFRFTTGYEEAVDATNTYQSYQMTLYEFDSPADAATFDQVIVPGYAAGGMTARQDTRLPAAWTLDSKKEDVGLDSYDHDVIARKQNRVMILEFTDQVAGTTPPLATLIAQQQYARL